MNTSLQLSASLLGFARLAGCVGSDRHLDVKILLLLRYFDGCLTWLWANTWGWLPGSPSHVYLLWIYVVSVSGLWILRSGKGFVAEPGNRCVCIHSTRTVAVKANLLWFIVPGPAPWLGMKKGQSPQVLPSGLSVLCLLTWCVSKSQTQTDPALPSYVHPRRNVKLFHRSC